MHGAPLGDEDVASVKTKFGFDADAKFAVPEEVYAFYREAAQRGTKKEAAWTAMLEQ